MGQFQPFRPGLHQNPRHRTAHRAKAEDSDAQWALNAGLPRGLDRQWMRRYIRFGQMNSPYEWLKEPVETMIPRTAHSTIRA
jgi:hypothetical protein